MVRPSGSPVVQPGETGKWLDTAEGWAKANLLYEKTGSLPAAGSLREALFLTVWSKRQQAEVWKTKAILSASAGGDAQKMFNEYVDTVFPFAKGQRAEVDSKMKKMMEKEVAKGMLTFQVSGTDFFKKKVKEMRVPDEFKKKLYARNRTK